jgi:solute carrier family 25 (mitochondrial uncoupling protein), member 8/9
MAAGLVATVMSNPLDVVSTRIMAAKDTQFVQKGTLETILEIWRREGITAFYSGFGPNILRTGSFNIVLWLSYEQIRRLGKEPAVVSN